MGEEIKEKCIECKSTLIVESKISEDLLVFNCENCWQSGFRNKHGIYFKYNDHFMVEGKKLKDSSVNQC